jgi:HlyD family secretion protein
VNKRKPLLLALGLLVLAGVGTWLLLRRSAGLQSISGTIETDEVHVASRYGGRVKTLFAQEGDVLTAGQPIAELDAAELQARRDYSAAVLAEMEHGPRPDEIAAAKHDWESLSAQLPAATADAQRARELFDEKVISESEMQNTTGHADALAQSADAAKKRYDLLVEGTRQEQIDQARAQLAELDAQLREMRITAPTNCVLEVLGVKVGDVLSADREVATLILPQHLWVRVYVPETWLGSIQLGQAVDVRTDTVHGKSFQGTVEQINREAEFTPRNVQTVDDRIRQVFGVKVRLPSDTGDLRAGMSVDAVFPNVPPPPK